MTTPAVVLRVRTLRRVHRDGDRDRIATVFCPWDARSHDLRACLSCSRLTRIVADAIECTPFIREAQVLPMNTRLGADTRVGEVAGPALLCVDADLSAPAVAAVLQEEDAGVAVLVDDEGRSVGLLSASDAALAARALVCVRRVAKAIAPVHESAPLAHAIDRMVRERARALPVTTEGHRVVALLTDIDALAWVASLRRARRG